MSSGHIKRVTDSQNLGSSIVQTLGRQVLAIVVGLGTAVFFARTLGPERRGQYALALLLATSLTKFLNLGIEPANIYFLGQNKISVKIALDTSIQLWWKLSVIGTIAGILIICFKANAWFPNTPSYLLFFSLLIFPIALLQSYFSSLFQGVQDFYSYNRVLLVSPIITFIAAVILVKFAHQGVFGALTASVIGSITALTISIFLVGKHFTSNNFFDEKKYGYKCLNYGLKAYLSNILAFVNYKADIFMVNIFLTPTDVGIYVVSINLVERLWILSSSVSTVILPHLAALHQDEAARKTLTPIIARIVFFITLLGSLILAIFSRPIVIVLFGSAFSEAINAVLGLIPGIVILSLARILANDIAARGRPELNTYASVLVIVVNIISNIFLIPMMGIVGAALSTSISYVVIAAFKLFIYSRLSGNRWWEPLVIQRRDLFYLMTFMKSNKKN